MWCILALAALTGCSKATTERIRESRDKESLMVSVETYWAAVRWNDIPSAAWFLDSLEGRATLTRLLADPPIRISDEKVLGVEVGPSLLGVPADPTVLVERTGVAMIRVETVDVIRGKVTTESVEQRWQKTGKGWRIDETLSPVDQDRPW